MSHQSRRQEIIDQVASAAADQVHDVPILNNLDVSNNSNASEGPLLGVPVPNAQYKYHWLDAAKSEHNGPYNDQLVEEVKAVYSVFGLLPFMIIYWLVCTASTSLFYSQGCQMNYYIGSFEIPIASVKAVDIIAILILIPFLDRLVYPCMRKQSVCCKCSMLRKIGVGYFVLALTMISAGLVEIWRKQSKTLDITSACDSSIYISDLNVLWQCPQYILTGASNVFADIVSNEFFSSQAPKSMKGIVYSLNLVVIGIGCLIATLLQVIVAEWIQTDLNDGHLEYYFFLVAGIMLVTLILFIPYAGRYAYRTGTDPRNTKAVRLDDAENGLNLSIEMAMNSSAVMRGNDQE